LVPDGDLMKEAETLAKLFANGPTRSFGTVKKLLNESFTTTLETQMEQEARGICEMTKTKVAWRVLLPLWENDVPYSTLLNGQASYKVMGVSYWVKPISL